MDGAVVHNFHESNRYSQRVEGEPDWIAFYRGIWPDMLAAVRIDRDSTWQRTGVDRLVYLPGGQQFTIDEKVRRNNHDDILLEEWSVCGGFDFSSQQVINPAKVGWALDKQKVCDYIAYAVPKRKWCWLLPFDLLRRTTERNIAQWRDAWKGTRNGIAYPIEAKNEGYSTISIGVQWEVLGPAITDMMWSQFGTSGTALPNPRPDSTPDLAQYDWADEPDAPAPEEAWAILRERNSTKREETPE